MTHSAEMPRSFSSEDRVDKTTTHTAAGGNIINVFAEEVGNALSDQSDLIKQISNRLHQVTKGVPKEDGPVAQLPSTGFALGDIHMVVLNMVELHNMFLYDLLDRLML